MIAIVDYGVGNLFSLASSVRSLGLEVTITRNAADLRAADHILLPGVGHRAGAGSERGNEAHPAAGHLPWYAAAV